MIGLAVLASLLDIDHDILTQPVIILDILPTLDDWTRRCSNCPRTQLVTSYPGTVALSPLLQAYCCELLPLQCRLSSIIAIDLVDTAFHADLESLVGQHDHSFTPT